MTTEVEKPNIIEPNVVLEDVTKRYEEKNPRNYDALTLARKKVEVAAMMKHWDKMSPAWLEMCWDFVENTSPERVAEIINTKEFEKPSTSDRQIKGGIIENAITVEEMTEEEVENREHRLNDFEIENKKNKLENNNI